MTHPQPPSSLLQPLRTVALIGAGDPAPQNPRDFEDGRHPFVRTADVGRVRRSAAFRAFRDRLTDDAIRRRRMRLWPAGTILVPKSGASTVLNNRVRLAEPAYASSHLATVRARPGTDEAFLYHLLCNLDARLLMGNAGYPSISLTDLGAAPVSVPPLSEQRRIAEALDRVEEAVTDAGRLIIATEELRDALRHELLTTGLPHSERERERVGDRDEDPVAHTIEPIPLAWPVVRLGAVAEVNPKRPVLRTSPDAAVPFVPMRAVAPRGRGFLTLQSRPFREISSGYTYFAEGDVLFSKITPCLENGKHALANLGGAPFGFGTTEFHVIRPGPRATADYLFNYLTHRTRLEYCAKQFTGSAGQRRLPADVLRALSLPLPSLVEQHRMSRVLRSCDARTATLQIEANALSTLRTALSLRLLSGQTRYSDRRVVS